MNIIGTIIICIMWLGIIYYKYRYSTNITLVEIAIVVAVITLLCMIAVPSLTKAICKQNPLQSGCIAR